MNMITSFDNNVFNVTGQMNAITLNDINVLNKNEKIKVYIPKVMVNIDKGEPLIKKIEKYIK